MRAIYLSDICNASGTHIEQYIWKTPMILDSVYTWPAMPKPTPSEWHLWQTALQCALSLRHNLSLPIPLGKWKHSGKSQTGWLYNEEENALYHCMLTSLTRHSVIPRQSRTHYFHGEGETMEELVLPTAAKVATVAKVGMWLMLTGIGETVLIPKHNSNSW